MVRPFLWKFSSGLNSVSRGIYTELLEFLNKLQWTLDMGDITLNTYSPTSIGQQSANGCDFTDVLPVMWGCIVIEYPVKHVESIICPGELPAYNTEN